MLDIIQYNGIVNNLRNILKIFLPIHIFWAIGCDLLIQNNNNNDLNNKNYNFLNKIHQEYKYQDRIINYLYQIINYLYQDHQDQYQYQDSINISSNRIK